MSFETKEQVLERILEMDKPDCPHCGTTMNLWEVPDIAMGDGLGWGSPYLYICFNEDCPLYRQGWDNVMENWAHKASYRCMCYPGTEQYECIPVFSPAGGSGQIIDDNVLQAQEELKEAIKRGFSILADLYVSKNWVEMVRMLLDGTEPNRVRIKAAEMIGDVGDIEAIEPLRSHKFGNALLGRQVETAVTTIHDRFYTRECPFCAEIIKQRANLCKYCGKEIAGQ